jgi:ribosomal protein S6
MIELGSNRLISIIRSIPDISNEKLRKAVDYYEKIISTAFQWQRSGKIREMMKKRNLAYRIPFKDRTWGLGDVGGATYRAFLDMLHTLEKKAARRGEYEKAILWRDAIWRLENKTDIYEAINAIDLLRKEIPNEDVEKIIEKYRGEYKRLRGGQPEDRI